MLKEKVRDLEEMPSQIKKDYCKILSLMITTEEEIDQFKMAEFYRLMAKMKVNHETRIEILNFIKDDETIENILQRLYSELNGEEKNIVRFSLMKDLITLSKASCLESSEKQTFLNNAQKLLDISETQMKFFEEEYKRDKLYFKKDIENNIVEKVIVETIAHATALGIPLTAVFLSGTIKGLGALGLISGLRALGGKKVTGKYSVLVGVGTAVFIGIAAYKVAKKLFCTSREREEKIKELMWKEVTAIHQDAIKAIEEDILAFNKKTRLKEKSNKVADELLQRKCLLEKSLAILCNAAPRLI